jgi:predicted HicB family RNase H-like nuclease
MSILKQAGLRGLEQSSSTQLSLRGLESIAEFESNFHAAIEDYLAASQVLCSSPEKPASGKLMLRISPEKHAAAIKAAA